MTPTSKSDENDDKTTKDDKATGGRRASGRSTESQLADVRTASAEEPMNLAGNQLPTTVTGKNFDQSLVIPTVKTQPVVGVEGLDGSHTSASSKVTDNVWTPYKPPVSFQPPVFTQAYIWLAGSWITPVYNKMASDTNDTADLSANSLTLY